MQSTEEGWLRRKAGALAVFAAGACLSLLAWHWTLDVVQDESRIQFEKAADEAVDGIQARFRVYTTILLSTRALLMVNEDLSRAGFERFLINLDLERNFPGTNGVSFTRYLAADQKERFEARVRAEGRKEKFTVWPSGRRSDYYVLDYIYPLERNASAFGRDLGADPVRRAQQEATRDVGQLSISGRVEFAQAPGQAGVSLRLPVYRHGMAIDTPAQRREALIGLVGAGFLMDELVGSALRPVRGLTVGIHDAGEVGGKAESPRPDNLLYTNAVGVTDTRLAPLALTRDLAVGGRLWRFAFQSLPEANWSRRHGLPLQTLSGGLLCSLLLALIIQNLIDSRRQARAELLRSEQALVEVCEARAALLVSESRLQRMVDHLPTGALYVQGENIFFNQALERITGYQKIELPDLNTWFAALYGPRSTEVRALYEAARAAGFPAPVELPIQTRDDTTRFVEFAAYGDAQGEVWVIQDITERKAAEAELRLAASVFENSSEAILITDAQNRIISVNKAFETITGYSQESVRGQNPKLLSSGRHPPDFYRDMWAQINTTGHWSGEMWDRKRGGAIYPKWLNISAIADASGQVSHYMGVFSDITERKAAEERIQFMAHYDPLTRLPNRTLLQERIRAAQVAAERTSHKFALLFLDLDHFKTINDSLGHAVGDRLLQAVAGRIDGCLRKMDTVARLGGDEFVIVVTETSGNEEAAHMASRIRQTLCEPYLIDGHALNTTPSIGISIYPDDGWDGDVLIKHADIAMYHAKEAGRNEIRFFNRGMNERALARQEIESSLHQALSRQEFLLHYQPQIDLQSGEIVGCEALVRWQHPQNGLVPPGIFIPVAEETGLIHPIGEWVLKEACRQNVAWQQAGLPAITVAVNLSAVQFRQSTLPADVATVLAESGLAPHYLELELTESTVMKNVESTVASLHALKAIGVTLSIDDFGTGYSGLYCLTRFPVDRLKIDQSFVRSIGADGGDAIAIAIINMARGLGLRTVAEGVETSEQRAFLHAHRCDEAQGYFYARPLPAEDFATFLRKHLEEGERPRP